MPNDYANPKVRALMAHVSNFESRDFLDAAQAMLDQSCIRSTSFNVAYAAVEKVIAEETPEGEDVDPIALAKQHVIPDRFREVP